MLCGRSQLAMMCEGRCCIHAQGGRRLRRLTIPCAVIRDTRFLPWSVMVQIREATSTTFCECSSYSLTLPSRKWTLLACETARKMAFLSFSSSIKESGSASSFGFLMTYATLVLMGLPCSLESDIHTIHSNRGIRNDRDVFCCG